MTIKKRIISFIILNVLCFITITSLYFNTSVCANSLTDYGSIFSTFTRLVGANEDVPINVLDSLVFDAICPRDAGFMSRVSGRLNYELTKKCIAKYLNNKYSNQDKTKDNITQSDINEFSHDLSQNISYTDQSTTYNNYSKSMVNLCINEFINESGYTYVYTYNAQLSITSLSNGTQATAIKNLIEQKQDGFHLAYTYGNGYCYLLGYPERSVVWVKSGNEAYPHDATTWQAITTNQPSGGFQYNMDSSGNTSTQNTYGIWREHFTTQNNSTFNMQSGGAAYPVSYGKTRIYKLYDSIDVYKSESLGESKYYINTTTYNNYKNSSGDYIVNNDNSNHATYGDVQTYIDDYHTENNVYPTPTQIEIYIEQVPAPTPTPTPTPTPDNPSGGGSGSSSTVSGGNASATATANGGTASANNEGINITINNNHNINLGGGSGLSGNTVSGNGSGSSGGIGGIFDFLSQIGDFLGSLIKNIGNVLADIVTGIGSVVSSLLEVIPTVFNDFLGGVLGWLPPELRALVTLSISAMIIVGLIKLFRG